MRPLTPIFALSATLLSAPAQASTTVSLLGNSTSMSNCIPFGSNYQATPPDSEFMGFVYQNVPAFSLQAGDTIAFDLGLQNDYDIVMDVALATAASNG